MTHQENTHFQFQSSCSRSKRKPLLHRSFSIPGVCTFAPPQDQHLIIERHRCRRPSSPPRYQRHHQKNASILRPGHPLPGGNRKWRSSSVSTWESLLQHDKKRKRREFKIVQIEFKIRSKRVQNLKQSPIKPNNVVSILPPLKKRAATVTTMTPGWVRMRDSMAHLILQARNPPS